MVSPTEKFIFLKVVHFIFKTTLLLRDIFFIPSRKVLSCDILPLFLMLPFSSLIINFLYQSFKCTMIMISCVIFLSNDCSQTLSWTNIVILSTVINFLYFFLTWVFQMQEYLELKKYSFIGLFKKYLVHSRSSWKDRDSLLTSRIEYFRNH